MTGTRHPGGIATVAVFRPWRSSRPPAIRSGHHKHRINRCPAEREGFEPSVRVNAHTLSKRAPSATQTPLLVQSLACHTVDREEREGFEPSVGVRPTLDFESSAFNHSATSPHSFVRLLLTTRSKKLLEYKGTFTLSQTRINLQSMVQPSVSGNLIQTLHSTRLRV